MNELGIKRGDVFYVYKSADYIMTDQNSGRPAVVVSNNLCNMNSEYIEVVYCTTNPKKDMNTHVRIMSTGVESTALCEQIYTIHKSRIGDHIGTCSKQEMSSIDLALMISLGIEFGRSSEPVKETNEKKPDVFEELKKDTKLKVLEVPGNRDLEDKFVRAETERDTYKQLYTELLAKIIEKRGGAI